MKTKIFLLILLVIGLNACNHRGVRGNGNIITEERNISNFTAVEASGVFRVYIEVGPSTSLKVEAEENLMKYIQTKVSGSTLMLDQKKNLNPKEQITVYLTTPELDRIESSGASKVFAENIDSEYFKLDVSGAGKVKLVGSSESFSADISGAAEFDGFDFKCEDIDIDLSGASNAEIYCDGILKADISGVGKVIYDGTPKNIFTDISGLGKVSSR